MKLTPKQERFVTEYLIDLNATQAAIRAGYSKHTADVQGPRLLRNVGVRAAIEAGQKRISTRLEVTAERVVQEYARLAFTNLRDAAEWGDERGLSLVLSEDLDEDTAAAVKSVTVRHTITNKGKDDEAVERVEHKIEMHDKKGALDSLSRHLGLFVDKTEITGTDGGPIVIERPTREL